MQELRLGGLRNGNFARRELISSQSATGPIPAIHTTSGVGSASGPISACLLIKGEWDKLTLSRSVGNVSLCLGWSRKE
ncbi:hypothetical protein GCM10011515_15630 [Tsuneonella deserti]|uniref:Uncharacterized protein n=1 Tax=Tsuneonella deserti TaxID=2035528 RepID=A0ABQ1S9Q5_9SPHN|nr:hypothetical protein GCM10011515_15630 [Tsuneonella deserti]